MVIKGIPKTTNVKPYVYVYDIRNSFRSHWIGTVNKKRLYSILAVHHAVLHPKGWTRPTTRSVSDKYLISVH